MITIPSYGFFFNGTDKKNKNLFGCIDRQFELASLSKSITAFAIKLLEERGMLSEKDAVAHYFPELEFSYKGKKQEITIVQLLQHTSGISKKTLCYQVECAHDMYNVVKRIAEYPLHNKPGVQYEYATGGYVVLGLIIEKITGKSFGNFLNEEVFIPLGMNNSLALGRPLVGTKRMLNKLVCTSWEGCYAYTPAGYIVSTLEDMKKWLHMFTNTDSIQNEFSRIVMRIKDSDHYVKTDEPGVLYGYGWFFNENSMLHYHDGQNPMYSTYMEYNDVQKTYGIVAIANAEVNAEKLYKKLYKDNGMQSNNSYAIESEFSGNGKRSELELHVKHEIYKKNFYMYLMFVATIGLNCAATSINGLNILLLPLACFIFPILMTSNKIRWRELKLWLSYNQLINIYLVTLGLLDIITIFIRMLCKYNCVF